MAAVGAVWWGVLQWRLRKREARGLESASKFSEEVRRPEAINVLKSLYSADPKTVGGHSSIQEFERVLDRLEWLGMLLRKRAVSEDVCMMLGAALALRVWYVMQQYIVEMNEQRGRYARNVRFLVESATEYQIKHEPRSEWPRLRVPTMDRAVDLVPEILRSGILCRRKFTKAKKYRLCRIRWNASLRMLNEEWAELQACVDSAPPTR